MQRTNTCGELTAKEIGKKAFLCGWVDVRRDHGGVIFIDLRDRYGITQAVFNPDKKFFKEAEHLRREDCIGVSGKIRSRPEGMKNPKMRTGEIEVVADELFIYNRSEVPPLTVDDEHPANEDMRMRYRYLDLRRPSMQKKLAMRHEAAQAARAYLSSKNFLEIETPLLVRATPEGARDYVVPSRVHPGNFYALPQSPQLYKQILMCSGVDRYFQLPRCLRDEDLRMDRQPEHTQIDVEMSFPSLEDLWETGEGVIKAVFEKCANKKIKAPFRRIPHKEAAERYGTDKPDLRYGLLLSDVTEIINKSDFQVFKNITKDGGIVKAINPEKDLTRKEIEDYTSFVQQLGAKGLAWVKVNGKALESNIAKFFGKETQEELIKKIGAKDKSTIFFMAGSLKNVNQYLDKLRQKMAADFKLYDPDEFEFCWIINFPLFEWNEEEDKWDPAHHMFCMPFEEDMKYLETDPGKVCCTQFDLVLNGIELASGSLRINRPEVQERVMNVIGLDKKAAERKFGFLLEAFKYGAPPHGGFGMGFDRIVALMAGTNDIREVIAFPKNKAAQCLMDNSPSEIEPIQMKELHIKIEAEKAGKKEDKK